MMSPDPSTLTLPHYIHASIFSEKKKTSWKLNTDSFEAVQAVLMLSVTIGTNNLRNSFRNVTTNITKTKHKSYPLTTSPSFNLLWYVDSICMYWYALYVVQNIVLACDWFQHASIEVLISAQDWFQHTFFVNDYNDSLSNLFAISNDYT